MLNGVTRRGPFLGNSAGVIALVYNGVNSTIGYYRGKREWLATVCNTVIDADELSDDATNSIAAGALSGIIFKSTRGIKPMLISGSMVASVAGVWAVSSSWTLLYSDLLTRILVYPKASLVKPPPSIIPI
jgi:import inner membrane translocase subunit TIM23